MQDSKQAAQRRFGAFAWLVLAYNIPVILWGAYVRLSFSGDGCGANWPTCNGQYLPGKMSVPTAIEFTHRMMTSLDTCLVIALCIWAFLAFPKRHAVRRYSLFSLLFLFIEALLGAGLVLLRLVAKDQSAGRVWYLSAHLTNTLLLLAALTITAWLAWRRHSDLRWTAFPRNTGIALAIVMLVSITGVIAALGDTLFPAVSVMHGMQQDFSSSASTLLRLRTLHPFFAILGAAYLLWMANRSGVPARILVIAMTLLQIVAGVTNIALLAPVWMQLLHLLIADALWASVLVLGLEMSFRLAPVPWANKTDSVQSQYGR